MNDESPTISVIIPCYNGEKFIAEAIKSVLNQTYKEFEIIVVDDGSIDGTRTQVEPYLTNRRIKFIQHNGNKGIAAARNTGITHSRGEFITFLDQDDLWLPEKLEKQIKVMLCGQEKPGLVFTGMLEIKEDGTTQKKPRKDKLPPNINSLSQKKVTESLFMYNFIPLITAMVRRECFDKVGLMDESIKGGADDYDICLRIADKYKVKYIDTVLAVHRIHEANYSNDERFFYDNMTITSKMAQQIPYLVNLVKKKQSTSYFDLGRFYQLNSEFHLARKMFIKSIKNYPFQTKSLIALLLSCFGPLGNRFSQTFKLIQKKLKTNK